jgi:hypothetical protein
LTTLFSSSFVSAAETSLSNFACVFERHYVAYLEKDKTELYNKVPTQLSFIGEKTTTSALGLNATSRASNSTRWTLVVSDATGAKYIGNSGDLLTIFYKPGAGFGEYEASLQWAISGYAFSSIGSCIGRP